MTIYENYWLAVLKKLETYYDEETYNEIFSNLTKIYTFSNGYISVLVNREFDKNRLNKLYINRINEFLQEIAKENIKVKFITLEDIKEPVTKTYDNVIETKFIRDLNVNYSFNNYVVGKSNNYAFRVAMKVADQPGIFANPLYIFGNVGLGKTHLMQAIGNYILDGDITKKIAYFKADKFIEDYFNSTRKNKTHEFNEAYRDVDVLLVDDIQILSNAQKSQVEFFKLFDILFQSNKQIVITSDKPASELTQIMDRLTSRFQAGIMVDIQNPDLELRVEILRRKLILDIEKPEIIPDEVLSFIASNYINNIRELEGALKRVLSYCTIYDVEVTLETANQALETLLKTKRKSNTLNENNYDKLQSVVSDFYKITVADLIGKSRNGALVLARHIAMYLIKTMYDLPYKTIGALFNNRDHSTVIAAYEKIENELKTNIELQLAIDTIKKKFNSN